MKPKRIRQEHVSRAWSECKKLDPDLTTYWWDDRRKQWVGGWKSVDMNRRGQVVPRVFEWDLGENLDQAYDEIQRHITKLRSESA